jgi:hypothetical protein
MNPNNENNLSIIVSNLGNTNNTNNANNIFMNNTEIEQIPLRIPKLLILIDLYAFTKLTRPEILGNINELTSSLFYKENKRRFLTIDFNEEVPTDLRKGFAFYMFYFSDRRDIQQYVFNKLFNETSLENIFVPFVEDLKKIGQVVLIDQLYPLYDQNSFHVFDLILCQNKIQDILEIMKISII